MTSAKRSWVPSAVALVFATRQSSEAAMIRPCFYTLLLTVLAWGACGRGFGVQTQECGNGVQEGTELCDGLDLGGRSCASLNLGDGTLACDATCRLDVSGCSVHATCGNGVLEYPESCDGTDLGGASCSSLGLSEGTLGCDASCQLDTRDCGGGECGDSYLSGSEVCDGTELGGATCRGMGFYGGTLACASDCLDFDTEGCSGRCGDDQVNGPEICDGMAFGTDSCAARGYYSGALACAEDCLSVDSSGCTGTCGDGVTNGPEACDGDDVGNDSCENHGLEGTLRCLGDCSDVDLSSCRLLTLLITEIGLGNPDWVEILNTGSTTIDLDGWTLEWWGIDGNNQPASGLLTLPAYSLGAGDRVVVYDEYNGDPSNPPTVDTTAKTIIFHVNIWWGAAPGAVALSDPLPTPVDFARWGDSTTDPPTGISWADTPVSLPGSNSDDFTLSRVPDTTDTDAAADFCRAVASPGAANASCLAPAAPGAVLISEVHDAQPTDRVELLNAGGTAVDLAGFSLYATNGTGTLQTLPSYVLDPGQLVAVIDDSTGAAYVDGAGIHVANLNIAPASGVVILIDGATDSGVDFVRWGGMAVDPVAPDTWADTPAAIGAFPATRSLGRTSSTDTNTAGDFCFMDVSMGTTNTACNP